MTLLSAGRELLSSAFERRSPENPAVPLTSSTLIDLMSGPPTAAGVHVSEKTALGIPATFRAISLVSGSSAGLPLHGYRDEGETRQKVSPRPKLIREPHPDLTQFEWLELCLVHALSWGNTYIRKLRDSQGIVRELWPIEPGRVKAGRTSAGEKVYEIDASDLSGIKETDRNGRIPLTDEEILHVPAMGYDGIVGLSPIGVARQSFALAMAAEKYGAKLYGSGSMLSGVLSTDQKINTKQADEVRERWRARHSGVDNAHDIAVIGGGTKFIPISIPPQDAQFLESRRFQVAEIARMFGVPPHLLMDTERSTSWGTGIEEQSTGFVVYTLRPWLIRFEQRLSRLLPSPQYAKFTVEGLLRGDTKSRYESYAIGRQWGWLSVNDIRRLEDMPPVPDGDGYLQPLNMDELGADPTPAELPAPEEAPADA